jgi:GTP-binding protein
MANSTPIVSVIGRPNVGKSSLFNRVIGKRIAVVDDMPGVTRDRNYYAATWGDLDFMLVDTGGMLPDVHEGLPEAIHEQVKIAVKESAAVLFMVDVTTGVTDLDLLIAKQIRRVASDKVLLVVNKTESLKTQFELDIFRSLGLGAPNPISALHGQGVADLLDKVVRTAKKAIEKQPKLSGSKIDLKLAIIGRPNAGKSSLVNKLLKQERMIVDSEPGTTRDSIDTEMIHNGKNVVLIDTAGLRKKSHVKHDVEYYSNLRALESIERCDVCALVIDVTQEIGVQDLRILRKVLELRKGVLLVWNKWDIMEKDHKTFDNLAIETRRQFQELKHAPMISISALTGQRVTSIIDEALAIKDRMKVRLPSAEFEDQVFAWARVHPHPAVPEAPVRFMGAKQVESYFPFFRFFVTNPDDMAPSYIRYLLNKIHETYSFSGCPVVLEFKPIAKAKRHWGIDTLRAEERTKRT